MGVVALVGHLKLSGTLQIQVAFGQLQMEMMVTPWMASAKECHNSRQKATCPSPATVFIS